MMDNATAEKGSHALPLALRVRLRQVKRRVEAARGWRRGIGSTLAIAFVCASWIAGAAHGGKGDALLSGIAGVAGLSAAKVTISGQIETGEGDVLAALSLDGNPTLLGFDANGARSRIAALPWVREVAIRKLYPDRLSVSLVERKPMAVWQHEERLTVIDRHGEPIVDFGIADLIENRFSHLPHLVGDEAADHAGEILPLASQFPEIARRAQAYIHVDGQRWDVEFQSGKRLLLPTRDTFGALARVAKLHEQESLFDRQLTAVDLRLGDRITLRLAPDAAEMRAEFVAARAKAMTKADRQL